MKLEYDVLKHVLPETYVSRVETGLLDFFGADWHPSVPLPAGSDHIVRSWPFVSLIETLLPNLFYLLIIAFGFVVIRKDRKLLPDKVIYLVKFFYNFSQIFLCSYMFIECFVISLRYQYNPYLLPLFGTSSCNVFDAAAPRMAGITYVYFLSKLWDYMDTILIIVSGKVEQFTFLHCYHHLTIFATCWVTMNLAYDGDTYLGVMINSFVHAVMYTYYLISMHIDSNSSAKSGKSGNGKQRIWWKKYITSLQLAQFSLLMVQGILILLWNCKETPPRVTVLYIVYLLSMLGLFMRFYSRAYKGEKKAKKN